MNTKNPETNKLLSSILRSVFFSRSTRRAGRLARNGTALWSLLGQVSAKSGHIKDSSVGSKLQTLVRLVRAYVRGEYKVVPWNTLVKIVAALVYFVSPLDFIPDLLPILGFTDDVAIVLWVISSCAADIRRFEEWEATHAKVVG